ncbi:hypothetical protein PM082_023147 [Marasmius tenuissimus]|nr:hypothetical protein PM082_023147 [Marasmius tenuissimus]
MISTFKFSVFPAHSQQSSRPRPDCIRTITLVVHPRFQQGSRRILLLRKVSTVCFVECYNYNFTSAQCDQKVSCLVMETIWENSQFLKPQNRMTSNHSISRRALRSESLRLGSTVTTSTKAALKASLHELSTTSKHLLYPYTSRERGAGKAEPNHPSYRHPI